MIFGSECGIISRKDALWDEKENAMDIDALRREIDGINDGMLALFVKRMELSEQVAAYKRERGLPVTDPAREQAILDRMAAAAGDYADGARELFGLLMELSRRRQTELGAGK